MRNEDNRKGTAPTGISRILSPTYFFVLALSGVHICIVVHMMYICNIYYICIRVEGVDKKTINKYFAIFQYRAVSIAYPLWRNLVFVIGKGPSTLLCCDLSFRNFVFQVFFLINEVLIISMTIFYESGFCESLVKYKSVISEYKKILDTLYKILIKITNLTIFFTHTLLNMEDDTKRE